MSRCSYAVSSHITLNWEKRRKKGVGESVVGELERIQGILVSEAAVTATNGVAINSTDLFSPSSGD